jgi:hypothetical protein
MPFAVSWLLCGVPLVAAVFAGIGLRAHWSTEHHRFAKVLATLLATVAPLLACCSLGYVQFVRPLPAFDYRVESWGLLLSFSGTVVGLVSLRPQRWFSLLALAVSA